MKQININKAILYSGIGIYLFGYIALIVSDLVFNKQGNFQQPVLEIFTTFPPLFVIAFTAIYASIFEEIAFRGWIIKRKIWKHISLFLIVIYIYLSLNSIVAAILSAAILFVIFYKIKDARLKLILSVVSTSLLFGLSHYANYTDWGRPFGIIQSVGFSFIICYLGLRFGFIFCILGHFLNNLFAMLVLTVFISNDYSGEFSNKTYTAEISKKSFFNISREPIYSDYDRRSYNGNITQIANSITEFKNNTIYKAEISNLINYKFEAVANEGYLIDRKELMADFIEHTGIIVDTVYKPAYILIVNDTTRLKNPSIEDKNNYINNIRTLTVLIRELYSLPLVLKENQYNYDILLPLRIIDSISIGRDKEKAVGELKARLYQNYGIEIIRDSTKKARVITFREQM